MSSQVNNSLFDAKGRRIPYDGMRVFNVDSKYYYQLHQPEIRFAEILKRSQDFGSVDQEVQSSKFEAACNHLRIDYANHPAWKDLFGGVHVPFICPQQPHVVDLGDDFEKTLTGVGKAFEEAHQGSHFKAILQGQSKLTENISIAKNSRYEAFLRARKAGPVVGWYFPQALQEFDTDSQRKQMNSLPEDANVCLSGGYEVSAALIGTPGLLIDPDNYAPILCLSAMEHSDPRLVLLFKSYGPHLEFWCMTQMLTPTIKQVSEQWAGGLTLFKNL